MATTRERNMFNDDYFEDEDIICDNDELEDEDTDEEVAELNVDENGHVFEGRRRRRNRDDEYEPEIDDFEDRCPEAYGYDNADDE